MNKRSKHTPTDRYFNPEIQAVQCMLRFNICVRPVRTKITNTQNMNNSEMSTQKIPNLRVCSFNKRESKRINEDERKLHICSTD